MTLTSAVDHYENFPVASVLLPKRLRPAIASIYWFARSADDIADEGNALPSARLAALGVYREQLNAIAAHRPVEHSKFAQLANTIYTHSLPIELFTNLLTAFELDCTKKQYKNWPELGAYCAHSANPVGRIVLHLFKLNSPQNFVWSDSICTGLQLTNFLQDIAHDWLKMSRIYIPIEDLSAAQLGPDDIALAAKSKIVDTRLEQVLRVQHHRAAEYLNFGKPLVKQLPLRLGLEIATTIAGGEQILTKMQRQQYSGFAKRPKLERMDWIKIVLNALSLKLAPS